MKADGNVCGMHLRSGNVTSRCAMRGGLIEYVSGSGLGHL